MANYNRVILAGNLTRDPQVRFMSNEKAVCDFGLAINRKWRSADGENKEETTFVDVEAWGRTAELVGQYLTKGRQALVEGRLKFETWEDQNGGGKRSKLKVVADTVQFLGSQSEQQGGNDYSRGNAAPSAPAVPPAGPVDDEPPFS